MFRRQGFAYGDTLKVDVPDRVDTAVVYPTGMPDPMVCIGFTVGRRRRCFAFDEESVKGLMDLIAKASDELAEHTGRPA